MTTNKSNTPAYVDRATYLNPNTKVCDANGVKVVYNAEDRVFTITGEEGRCTLQASIDVLDTLTRALQLVSAFSNDPTSAVHIIPPPDVEALVCKRERKTDAEKARVRSWLYAYLDYVRRFHTVDALVCSLAFRDLLIACAVEESAVNVVVEPKPDTYIRLLISQAYTHLPAFDTAKVASSIADLSASFVCERHPIPRVVFKSGPRISSLLTDLACKLRIPRGEPAQVAFPHAYTRPEDRRDLLYISPDSNLCVVSASFTQGDIRQDEPNDTQARILDFLDRLIHDLESLA